MTLRDYQHRAVAAIHAAWDAGARRVLAVAPTGSGKTVLAVAAVAGSRVAWIAHRRELVSQAADALARAGAEVGCILPGVPPRPAPVQVATVQTLLARGARPAADVLVLDEAIHYEADDWRTLLDAYPHARTLGLTATPERTDGRGLADLFDRLIVVAQYSELIAAGHILPCRVFQAPELLDGSHLALDPVAAYQRHGEGARAFCFAGSVAVAMEFRDRFRAAGIAAELVEASTPHDERAAHLRAFAAGAVRVLSNVQCLDYETELLTPYGWRLCDALRRDDLVAQWDSGRVAFVTPRSIIARPRTSDEPMVVLDSIRHNLRVTGGHALLYKTWPPGAFRRASAASLVGRSLMIPISGVLQRPPPVPDVVQEHYGTSVPRAVASAAYSMRQRRHLSLSGSRRAALLSIVQRRSLRYKQPEELTDAECSFIGFWLGDGSRTRLSRGGVEYTLSQRSRDSGVVQWICGIIARCGLHAIHRRNYLELGADRWSLPRGTGRGCQKRAGVYAIEPYLIKDGTPLYWRFTSRQIDALLHGFWMAEGNHGPEGKRPRAVHVTNTNKRLLDLLQALASCHGYRAHLFLNRRATVNTKALWWLSFRKGRTHHRTSRAGAWLQLDKEYRSETVWCVEVPSGALVTRRRGAVTIVGNCLTEGVDVPAARVCILARGVSHATPFLQMVGRVLRPAANGDPKPDAIVIDLSGATHLHGLPTEDRQYVLAAEEGIRRTSEPALTVCPQCGRTHLSAERACPGCGYERPVDPHAPTIYSLALREVYAGADTARDAKAAEWARLRTLVATRGWSLAWAVGQYRKLFSTAPPLSQVEWRGVYVDLLVRAEENGYKLGWAAHRYRDARGCRPAWSAARALDESGLVARHPRLYQQAIAEGSAARERALARSGWR